MKEPPLQISTATGTSPLIAGLVAPDHGEVRLLGTTASRDGRIVVEPEHRNIGMVFQDLALWPHLTVEDNLAFGLKARGLGRREISQRTGRILETVQMTRHQKLKPGVLSGGEQQRLALARALVLEPAIVLMDEPLSSLNFELSARIEREILALQSRLGFTLVYITHSRDEAFQVGSRLLVIEQGKVVVSGGPDTVERWLIEQSRV